MTDDDICGHPTEGGDGPPCQNPPSEGEHCWLEAHGGEATVGRHFTLSEADHDDIIEAARLGKSETGCARAAGVGWDQLNRYLDAHPEFRGGFERARARGERRLIEGGLHDEATDSSMAKFLLSTSFDYVKTERREVTGDGGGPVEITFSEEVVKTSWSSDK